VRYADKTSFRVRHGVSFALSALACLWLCDAAAQSTSSEDAFGHVPQAAQAAINEQCLPIQYRDGAAAYRSCVDDALQKHIVADMTHFEALSFDEKYAVQQACVKDRRQNNVTYHECLQQQITELSPIPSPDLSDISDDEKYVLQQSCFNAQTQQGAAAYRQCINSSTTSLKQVPPVDLTHLSSLDRNGIQMGCSSTTTSLDAALYRLCLAQELASSGLERQQRNLPQTTKRLPRSGLVSVSTQQNPSADSPNSTRANEAVSSTQVASVSTQTTTRSTTLENIDGESEPVTLSKPQLTEPFEVANKTDNTLTATNSANIRDVIPASESNNIFMSQWLYAIPLVLILAALRWLYLLLKRRPIATKIDRENINPPIDFDQDWNAETHAEKSAAAPADLRWQFDDWPDPTSEPIPAHEPPLDDTVALAPWKTELDRQETSPDAESQYQPTSKPGSQPDAAPAGAPDRLGDIPDLATRLDEELREELDQTLVINHEDVEFDHSKPAPEIPPLTEAGDAVAGDQTPSVWIPPSTFGRYVEKQEPLDRKRLTTEFLLYWISYGDGNIESERAEQLLRSNPRDEHDFIKRIALQKDGAALADALYFLQNEFSATERLQTLWLLMAVLIVGEITPLQNTVFRFIADAIGIGAEGLQLLYRRLFGQVLPAMPRPDSPNWWQQIKNEPPGVNSELGLPDNATVDQLEAQRKLIQMRFNPARFDQLGEGERLLAQKYAVRFSEALDELMKQAQ